MSTRKEIDGTPCVANSHARIDMKVATSSGTSTHTNNITTSIQKTSTRKHYFRRFLLWFWILLSIMGPVVLVICAVKKESDKTVDKLQKLRTNTIKFADDIDEFGRKFKDFDPDAMDSLNRSCETLGNIIELLTPAD